MKCLLITIAFYVMIMIAAITMLGCVTVDCPVTCDKDLMTGNVICKCYWGTKEHKEPRL